jgi:hypothetical protein
MTTRAASPEIEPDEAAYPDLPGGGLVVAAFGGLAVAGAVLLVLFVPPLAVAMLATAAILTGAAVRQARHVITTTLAAVALPVLTSFAATCVTGVWGWLVVGIFLAAAVLLVVTPVAFGVGRLLRSRVGPRGYPVLRVVLVAAGLLGAVGWIVVLRDAALPGYCPPPL